MEYMLGSVTREREATPLDLFKYNDFHIDSQTFYNHNSIQSKSLASIEEVDSKPVTYTSSF